ncbi:DNRLRE domain-containing protein [Archangium gephyra]|nr:DNRLRE domain-containing protein [Archangium gephyra]
MSPWRIPLVLVLSLLSQVFSGCGSSPTVDEPSPFTVSGQSLAGTTCVTLQRGSAGTVADTHISSQQPAHTAGSEPVAHVGDAGRYTRQALLHFDTSSIPPHATLTSATLSLWRQGSSHPSPLTAHAITSPWQEQSVSWQDFSSSFAPQVAATFQASRTPGALSTSLRELVSIWVRNPTLNHGLLLQQSEGHSLLATSESPNTSHRPALQVCFFLPDSSPATSSAPSLLLRVLDDSGQPLSGAAVSSSSSQLPTDGAGYAVLDNLPSGFFSARVEAVGFAPAVVSLHLPPGARASHEVRLLPLGQPQPFAVSAGATLEHGTLRVSIPPHAVVDSDGRPVSGTVQATLVPLDPTTVPTSSLPGPLEGLVSEGASEPVPLESFGMAEVSLWQDGRPLQLAPGAKATLELLLPSSASSRLSPGDAIPAWWLDTARGLWVREGTGTVQHSSLHPGRLSWVVEVSHFTWWNCDAPLSDRSCVDVLVRYPSGLPAPGAQVGATGISYTGSSRTVYTGADGRACVEIKRGATARVFAGLSGETLGEATVTGSAEPTACGGGACTPVSLTITPPVCIPGSTQTCTYSGPASTKDVGLCRAAHRYCNTAGTAWGACEGEVLSASETCSNTFDEDCDGATNEGCRCGSSCYSGPPGTSGVGVCRAGTIYCKFGVDPYCAGQTLPSTETCTTSVEDDDCDGSLTCTNPLTQAWRYGNVSCQYSPQLLMSSDGNLIVSGLFLGTLEFGGGVVLTGSTSGYAAFLAKFDASTGGALWATMLASTQWAQVHHIQKDASGNLIVLGQFQGNLTVGGTTLSNPEGTDGFVVKLDEASGAVLWLSHLNSNGSTYIYTPVVDPSGNFIVSGEFYDNLTVGGTTLSNPRGTDGFVVKLDGATGGLLWLSHLDSADVSHASTPVVDASGNLIVSGRFEGNLTVGGITLSSPTGYDGFVVKLDGGSGARLWLVHLDSTRSTYSAPLVVEASGNLIVSDNFDGNFTVGGTTLSNSGGTDGVVVKLDGASGAVLWLVHFDSRYTYVSRPVVDASGNLIVLGQFQGNLTVGGTTLSNPEGIDGFVVKLDGASGAVLWLAHLDSTNLSYVSTPVVDVSGNLIVSSQFQGNLTVGGTTLFNPGGTDGFVVKLDGTSGARLWLAHLDGTNYTYASTPVMNASGNLIVSGYFDGNLRVGGVILSNSGSRDGFVANLQASSGAISWVRHFESTSGVSLSPTLVVNPENIFIAGSFDGILNTGGAAPLTSAGCYDMFLSRIASTP